MKKYIVFVSGTVDVIVEAENEEQAEERVEAVCATEAHPDEFGISDEHAHLLGEVENWCVDLVSEVPEAVLK